MRGEAALATGTCLLTLLWDLRKCYEYIRHWRLLREAELCEYPLAVLRLSLASYRWPRHIRQGPLVADVLWPLRGIVAGSSHATFELKVFLLQTVRKHASENPQLTAYIHVDDITQTVATPTGANTVRGLEVGARSLAEALIELELPIAIEKNAVFGTHKMAVEDAVRRMSSLTGKPVKDVRNLGVDFTYSGKYRSVGATRVRRVRLKASAVKWRKARRLHESGGKRSKVFIGGCLPMETYGLEVVGLTPAELQRMRARTAGAIGIGKPGWTTHQAWACRPKLDPVKHCAAGLLQYCKEWWKATDGSSILRQEALSPAELRDAFNSAWQSTNPLLPWAKQMAGPLSIMCLWLKFAGWSWISPTHFTTSKGDGIMVLYGAPRLVRDFFAGELATKYLEISVAKTYVNHGLFGENADMIAQPGLWLEPIQKLQRSSKFSAHEKYFAAAICCGWGCHR